MALNYVTITETFDDGSQTPVNGTAVFTPSQPAFAPGSLVSYNSPVTVSIVNGVLGSCKLLATDNTLTFPSLTGFFTWSVTVTISGISQTWSFFLPSNPSAIELYKTQNTPALGGIFLPLAGGTMTGWLAPAVATLTFGVSIPVNAALGNAFSVTLTASTGTLANPTSPVDGQVIRFRIAQDATGSRTLAFGTAYDFGAAGAPTLSTAASKVDVLGFEYVASLAKWVYLGSALGN